MVRRLEEFLNFTKSELDKFESTSGSCVHKINLNRRYALDPYVLSDLDKALPAYILKHEISYYEPRLNGVLLAVKNIKVLNGMATLRADDPHLHLNINADCFVFRPEQGAVLTGVVKYIGKHHVSVVLFRVYNAKINFKEKINKDKVLMGQDLKFRVVDFGCKGMFININGELLDCNSQFAETSTAHKKKLLKFENNNSENVDTAAEEEENRLVELDELLNAIKSEPITEQDLPSFSNENAKCIKRRQKEKPTSLTEDVRTNSNVKKRKRTSNDNIATDTKETEFPQKVKKEV